MNELLYRAALKTLLIYNRGRTRVTPVNIFLEKIIHFSRMNYYPNFKNPRIWSEYICQKKFYFDPHQLARTADKLRSREYVEKKIGKEYLTKLYDVISSESDITEAWYNGIPTPSIIKPNHASERVYLNSDKNFNKFREGTAAFLTEFGNRNNEFYYKLIPPKLIIEEYLDSAGMGMTEFKLWVFHGKVEIIAVSGNIHAMKQRQNYHFRLYDREWNDAPVQVSNPTKDRMGRPPLLERMIELAETLAGDQDFIRVDFMKTPERLVFGELTSIPAAGRIFNISLEDQRFIFEHYQDSNRRRHGHERLAR